MMGKYSYMKMKEIRTFLNTIHKNKLKIDKDINVRLDTTKFLEENIGRTLFDINCCKISFDPPPKIMVVKMKISKWVLIKLKSFCTAEETINKMKRHASEWEKILSNKATDKRLISKIYSLCNSISKKQPNQNKMGQILK